MFFSLRSRAFTLLELIVSIVVLGLLAAIAVPTFSSVLDKSRDAAAGVSLMAIGREAAALAAMEQDGQYEVSHVEAAVADAPSSALAPGVSAGAHDWALRGTPSERLSVTDLPGDGIGIPAGGPEQFGQIGFVYGDAYRELGLMTRSKSGRCVYSLTDMSGASSWWAVDPKGAECPAGAALDPQDGTLPSPINLVAAAEGTQAVLSWTAVPGADSYTVFTEVAGVTTETPGALTPDRFVVPGLTLVKDRVYTFEVVAVKGGEVSPPSNEAQLSTAQVAPALSGRWTNVTGEVTAEKPGLKLIWEWTPTFGATGYHVQYCTAHPCTAASSWSFSTLGLSPSTRSIRIESVTNNVWAYRVVPMLGSSLSSYSLALASNPVTLNGAPSWPSNSMVHHMVQPDARSVKVTHPAVSGADAYVLWYYTASDPTWRRTEPYTGTTGILPTVPNESYFYGVASVRNGVVGNHDTIVKGVYTIAAAQYVTAQPSAFTRHVDGSGSPYWTLPLSFSTPVGTEQFQVFCSKNAVFGDGDDGNCSHAPAALVPGGLSSVHLRTAVDADYYVFVRAEHLSSPITVAHVSEPIFATTP